MTQLSTNTRTELAQRSSDGVDVTHAVAHRAFSAVDHAHSGLAA